jgi:hypothetical protein
MGKPSEADIRAAMSAIYDHLQREQDAEWRTITGPKPDDENGDYVFLNGVFSLRMIALRAAEAVMRDAGVTPTIPVFRENS